MRHGLSATGASHSLTSADGLREWNAGTSAPRTELVIGRTTGVSVGFNCRGNWPVSTLLWANMRLSLDGAGLAHAIGPFASLASTATTSGQVSFTIHDFETLAEGYHIFSIFEVNFSATTLTPDEGYTKLGLLG